MQIPVLYENSDFVFVNKPAGLVVHPDGRTEEAALTDWFIEHYPEAVDVGEVQTLTDGTVIKRPGIVHRLDRDTSGVVVLAKTQESFAFLKEVFQEHRVHKTYGAFVYGHLPEHKGSITRQIGKSRKDFRKWSAQPGARGKLRDAITHYTVQREGEDWSYIEVCLETGRTHQIRVHFKAIHHPVICDSLYAPKKECILGFKRLALHATKIAFTDRNGDELSVEAPLPDDFSRALSAT